MKIEGSDFVVGQRVWTPLGEGRTNRVEDTRINDGDFSWFVNVDRGEHQEQHEEMFFERNLRMLYLIGCPTTA